MNVGSRATIATAALVTPAAVPAQMANTVASGHGKVGAHHQHRGDRADERLDRRERQVDLSGDQHDRQSGGDDRQCRGLDQDIPDVRHREEIRSSDRQDQPDHAKGEVDANHLEVATFEVEPPPPLAVRRQFNRLDPTRHHLLAALQAQPLKAPNLAGRISAASLTRSRPRPVRAVPEHRHLPAARRSHRGCR